MRDYVPLGELEVGTVLHVQGGGDAVLVSKTWRQGEFEVFDFEVEGLHNFYVRGDGSDAAGVLVHNSTGGTSRVGRWMNPKELGKMKETGKVQGNAQGVHRVASPANPDAYKAAPKGDTYATYDVPTESLGPAGTDAWKQISGPGSLKARAAARKGETVPDLPAFENLVEEQVK